MHLTALNTHEQLVLVGLYYWMIHADETFSPEERQRLSQMRELWGADHWDRLEAQAAAKYPSARALALGCRNVMRPAARKCIYDELVRLAGTDGYHIAEIKLLNWLALTWDFADAETVERAMAMTSEPTEEHNSFDLFG